MHAHAHKYLSASAGHSAVFCSVFALSAHSIRDPVAKDYLSLLQLPVSHKVQARASQFSNDRLIKCSLQEPKQLATIFHSAMAQGQKKLPITRDLQRNK